MPLGIYSIKSLYSFYTLQYSHQTFFNDEYFLLSLFMFIYRFIYLFLWFNRYRWHLLNISLQFLVHLMIQFLQLVTLHDLGAMRIMMHSPHRMSVHIVFYSPLHSSRKVFLTVFCPVYTINTFFDAIFSSSRQHIVPLYTIANRNLSMAFLIKNLILNFILRVTHNSRDPRQNQKLNFLNNKIFDF